MNSRISMLAFKMAGALVALCLSQSSVAEVTSHPVTSSFEIGPELGYFNYSETIPQNGKDVFFMRDTGYFGGIAAAWEYHGPFMLKVDGHYKAGQVHYESNGTGSADGTIDHILDLRGLVGFDFCIDDLRASPYTGFGYRYLKDNSYNDGKLSSTGAIGYDRESNYMYFPIGLEFERQITNLLTIGVNVEYDIFWHGLQVSHLEEDGNITPLINEQNKGYGLRGSVRVIRCLNSKTKAIFEPYIRYWRIDASEIGSSVDGWGESDFGLEPDNATTEVGFSIKVGL